MLVCGGMLGFTLLDGVRHGLMANRVRVVLRSGPGGDTVQKAWRGARAARLPKPTDSPTSAATS